MPDSLPPAAPATPGADDPYGWMRDTQLPAMREYLAAERQYYEHQLAPLRGLRDELRREMTARVAAAEESVRWRHGGFWYCTRTVPGQEFEQFCRAAGPDGPVQVLLDENALLSDPACSGGYVALGVREVSPDGRLLAYSVDFDGDEVYQLRIRDLATGQDRPDRIERTYYGLAWAADSRSLLYVVTDQEYRPHEVWRHELGTSPDRDVLVFREDDQRFELTVRATRSGEYLLIETESRDTTETLAVPAADPGAPPAVLAPRRRGVEYRADHARGPDGGEFYLVSNDVAAEFRLVRAPVRAPGRDTWTEVIAGAPDTRLVSCHVFGRYLVVEQRHARGDAAAGAGPGDRRAAAHRAAGPAVRAGAGGQRGVRGGRGVGADRVAHRPARLARRRPGHRTVGTAQAAGRARLRPGPVREPAADRGRTRRHHDPGDHRLPARAAPGWDRAVPAVRLRGVRGLFVAGVQRAHAQPAGPRLRLRGGARARRRGRRPPLVAGRAADPQAQHVHRLHRGRGHAGGGRVGGRRPDRVPRPVGRRAAAGRGVRDGPRPVAGGGGRGAVRGLRDHHARPVHPAHHHRVGRVGRPEGPGDRAYLRSYSPYDNVPPGRGRTCWSPAACTTRGC